MKFKNLYFSCFEIKLTVCFRLKFVVGTSGVNLFISSDMFYLEILVDSSSGSVKDVKIHHEGKVSLTMSW